MISGVPTLKPGLDWTLCGVNSWFAPGELLIVSFGKDGKFVAELKEAADVLLARFAPGSTGYIWVPQSEKSFPHDFSLDTQQPYASVALRLFLTKVFGNVGQINFQLEVGG